MPKHLLAVVLFTITPLLICAQTHLDVEGNAKIRGNIDLSHMGDTSSMFIGRNARINYFTATERRNTIVGVHSLVNSQSGDNAGQSNSIFGFDAGKFNRGNQNVFSGVMSGLNNRGSLNSFYGYSSGINNSFGTSNSFYGYRSGFNNTEGSQNSFFGYQAGSSNQTGGFNLFVGANSGQKNDVGSRNTYIGAQADQLNNGDSLDRAIAIGFNAKASCSHCAVIGGTGADAVKVGIGVHAPEATLQVHESNNTRIKISNSNSKEIFVDLVRNDAAQIDFDWRIRNSNQGNFEIAYHKTDLDNNVPTTLLSANASSLNPGANKSIDLGESSTRWRTVWAKSGQFSQLMQLEPISQPLTCTATVEGSIYYDKTAHKLKVCGFTGSAYKWIDLY
jgi:hypothetical protein